MHLLAVSFFKGFLTDFQSTTHQTDILLEDILSLKIPSLNMPIRCQCIYFCWTVWYRNNSFLYAFKQSSWQMRFVNWINYFWNSFKRINSVQNCPRYNNMPCPNIVYYGLSLSYLYMFIVLFHRRLCWVLTEAIFGF